MNDAPDAETLSRRLRRVPTGALAMHSEEEITRIMLAPRRERRRLVSVIRRAYRQAKRRST